MRRKYRIIGNRVKIPDDPVTVIRENSRKKAIVETPLLRGSGIITDTKENRIRRKGSGGTKDEKARELL